MGSILSTLRIGLQILGLIPDSESLKTASPLPKEPGTLKHTEKQEPKFSEKVHDDTQDLYSTIPVADETNAIEESIDKEEEEEGIVREVVEEDKLEEEEEEVNDKEKKENQDYDDIKEKTIDILDEQQLTQQKIKFDEFEVDNDENRPALMQSIPVGQSLDLPDNPEQKQNEACVEQAAIKIQALVRGHLARKALKGADGLPLGQRQFDDKSLSNPPSAIFSPTSPFNIAPSSEISVLQQHQQSLGPIAEVPEKVESTLQAVEEQQENNSDETGDISCALTSQSESFIETPADTCTLTSKLECHLKKSINTSCALTTSLSESVIEKPVDQSPLTSQTDSVVGKPNDTSCALTASLADSETEKPTETCALASLSESFQEKSSSDNNKQLETANSIDATTISDDADFCRQDSAVLTEIVSDDIERLDPTGVVSDIDKLDPTSGTRNIEKSDSTEVATAELAKSDSAALVEESSVHETSTRESPIKDSTDAEEDAGGQNASSGDSDGQNSPAIIESKDDDESIPNNDQSNSATTPLKQQQSNQNSGSSNNSKRKNRNKKRGKK